MVTKIDSGSNARMFAGMLIIFIGVSLYFASPESKLYTVMVGTGMAAFMAWFVVIPQLCHDVKLQWKAGDTAVEELKSQFLSQDLVDRRLKALANAFQSLCTAEIKIRGNETAEGELEKVMDDICEAKEAFWTAHGIANRQGYTVMAKVSDYVNLKPVEDE